MSFTYDHHVMQFESNKKDNVLQGSQSSRWKIFLKTWGCIYSCILPTYPSTHPPTYPSSIHLNIYVYIGLPCSSDSKESACNAGDPHSIPGLGRSSGGEERNSHILFPSLSTLNSFLFLQSFSTKFSHIVLPRVM